MEALAHASWAGATREDLRRIPLCSVSGFAAAAIAPASLATSGATRLDDFRRSPLLSIDGGAASASWPPPLTATDGRAALILASSRADALILASSLSDALIGALVGVTFRLANWLAPAPRSPCFFSVFTLPN